jgi:hypothetical protein
MYFADRYTQDAIKVNLIDRETSAGLFDEAARKHHDVSATQA